MHKYCGCSIHFCIQSLSDAVKADCEFWPFQRLRTLLQSLSAMSKKGNEGMLACRIAADELYTAKPAVLAKADGAASLPSNCPRVFFSAPE